MNEMEILVGTNQLDRGGRRYRIRGLSHHEYRANRHTQLFDIALVYVDGSIEFNDKVQPIKYSTEEVGSGENLQVTGWGLLNVRICVLIGRFTYGHCNFSPF